jgi:ribonuclease HII
MQRNSEFVIGVDEAGRGPLAGPVAVGLVCVKGDFDWNWLPGVTDSKKLSEKKREEIYKEGEKLEAAGLLHSAIVLGSAKEIDKKGIAVVIRECIARGLADLSTRTSLKLVSEQATVRLDGGLRAPATWMNQETIIKGDAKEKVIGMASILAKVTRDRYMTRKSSDAPFMLYDFERHKGYGTKIHRAAIAQHGLSSEHRQTYCKKIKLL